MNRKLIFVLSALVLCFVLWLLLRPAKKSNSAKEAPLSLQHHSVAFNSNMKKVVDNYLALKDAFVEADTSLIKKNTRNFITSLNSIDTTELKNDTLAVFETIMAAIMDVSANANSILQQTDITEMRRDFSSLTEMMYPAFFNAIQYEGPNLYVQNCPMAFNDSEPANWISNTKEINNPYLGKHHPKYHAGMLHCGDIKDTIKAKP